MAGVDLAGILGNYGFDTGNKVEKYLCIVGVFEYRRFQHFEHQKASSVALKTQKTNYF